MKKGQRERDLLISATKIKGKKTKQSMNEWAFVRRILI